MKNGNDSIRLSTGEIVMADIFYAACKQVANDWRELAHAIRKENAYAPHVDEETKERDLQRMLLQADAIESGTVDNFTIWQRVNEVLTGKCVALLGGI